MQTKINPSIIKEYDSKYLSYLNHEIDINEWKSFCTLMLRNLIDDTEDYKNYLNNLKKGIGTYK